MDGEPGEDCAGSLLTWQSPGAQALLHYNSTNKGTCFAACASTARQRWESPLPCTQHQPGHNNTKLNMQEGDKVFGSTKHAIRKKDT